MYARIDIPYGTSLMDHELTLNCYLQPVRVSICNKILICPRVEISVQKYAFCVHNNPVINNETKFQQPQTRRRTGRFNLGISLDKHLWWVGNLEFPS